MGYDDRVEFSDLVGKTLKAVYVSDSNDRVTFETETGEEYVMYHSQDCCESVYLEDVAGEWNDLVGSPILRAEENVSSDWPEEVKKEDHGFIDDSFTWTFYRIATAKGTVVLRWYGSSNGYYSESVYFEKVS